MENLKVNQSELKDPRSQSEIDYHLAGAEYELLKSSREMLARRDTNQLADPRIDFAEVQRLVQQPPNLTKWKSCRLCSAALIGATWSLKYAKEDRKLLGWDLGLILGAAVTWGTMVWYGTPPKHGEKKLENLFVTSGSLIAGTHIRIYNERGIEIGHFFGGGLGIGVYVGSGKAEMRK